MVLMGFEPWKTFGGCVPVVRAIHPEIHVGWRLNWFNVTNNPL